MCLGPCSRQAGGPVDVDAGWESDAGCGMQNAEGRMQNAVLRMRRRVACNVAYGEGALDGVQSTAEAGQSGGLRGQARTPPRTRPKPGCKDKGRSFLALAPFPLRIRFHTWGAEHTRELQGIVSGWVSHTTEHATLQQHRCSRCSSRKSQHGTTSDLSCRRHRCPSRLRERGHR